MPSGILTCSFILKAFSYPAFDDVNIAITIMVLQPLITCVVAFFSTLLKKQPAHTSCRPTDSYSEIEIILICCTLKGLSKIPDLK